MGPVVAPAGTTAVALVVVAFVGVTRVEVLKRTPVTVELNVPLIVTVEPTMPLVGDGVGAPGQVTEAPVEYANGNEFPVVLCATTGFDVLGAALFGIVTSSWVSDSMVSPVPLLPPKVTLSTGPPFATVWKLVPTSVTSHVGEAVVGVTDVIVGTAA
jgi:hypothetical protein